MGRRRASPKTLANLRPDASKAQARAEALKESKTKAEAAEIPEIPKIPEIPEIPENLETPMLTALSALPVISNDTIVDPNRGNFTVLVQYGRQIFNLAGLIDVFTDLRVNFFKFLFCSIGKCQFHFFENDVRSLKVKYPSILTWSIDNFYEVIALPTLHLVEEHFHYWDNIPEKGYHQMMICYFNCFMNENYPRPKYERMRRSAVGNFVKRGKRSTFANHIKFYQDIMESLKNRELKMASTLSKVFMLLRFATNCNFSYILNKNSFEGLLAQSENEGCTSFLNDILTLINKKDDFQYVAINYYNTVMKEVVKVLPTIEEVIRTFDNPVKLYVFNWKVPDRFSKLYFRKEQKPSIKFDVNDLMVKLEPLILKSSKGKLTSNRRARYEDGSLKKPYPFIQVKFKKDTGDVKPPGNNRYDDVLQETDVTMYNYFVDMMRPLTLIDPKAFSSNLERNSQPLKQINLALTTFYNRLVADKEDLEAFVKSSLFERVNNYISFCVSTNYEISEMLRKDSRGNLNDMESADFMYFTHYDCFDTIDIFQQPPRSKTYIAFGTFISLIAGYRVLPSECVPNCAFVLVKKSITLDMRPRTPYHRIFAGCLFSVGSEDINCEIVFRNTSFGIQIGEIYASKDISPGSILRFG